MYETYERWWGRWSGRCGIRGLLGNVQVKAVQGRVVWTQWLLRGRRVRNIQELVHGADEVKWTVVYAFGDGAAPQAQCDAIVLTPPGVIRP